MPELNKFQSPAFDLLNDSGDKKAVQNFIKKMEFKPIGTGGQTMRLIDADEFKKAMLVEIERLYRVGHPYSATVVSDVIKKLDLEPSVDAEPNYQSMSEDFARMITKGIASLLSELNLDLPSIIYEDIESSLLKGKFTDVECFIKKYIENNGAKMDEE